MYYYDDLIVGRVSKKIRKRTEENMNVYCLGLADATVNNRQTVLVGRISASVKLGLHCLSR